VGRSMRELREVKGLTYRTLAYRIDDILKGHIEDTLRGMGMDMRGAWPRRDVLLERLRVRPETLERWETVGFGVQRGTRAASAFYESPGFVALLRVLEAEPGDMDAESRGATLQPGDFVVRTVDDEGRPTLGKDVTGSVRFLALPDGFGGTYLKNEQHVVDADLEAVRTYLREEAAFVDAEAQEAIDKIVEAEKPHLEAEVDRLLEEQEE
jgi:hypothetical protein